VNLLIDTHVLLWLATDSRRVGKTSRALVAAADERWVSAASAHEIALKTRLGRLPRGRSALDGWSRLMRNLQLSELSLTVAHMARAGELEWTHRDPFDRMLVAQAQLEGLVLLTDDAAIRNYEEVATRWR